MRRTGNLFTGSPNAGSISDFDIDPVIISYSKKPLKFLADRPFQHMFHHLVRFGANLLADLPKMGALFQVRLMLQMKKKNFTTRSEDKIRFQVMRATGMVM